jgi:Helix-turn-helix.
MTITRTRRLFGKRVRKFRKTREYSQEQLADKAGLHRIYIVSIERGEQNISIDNIEKNS